MITKTDRRLSRIAKSIIREIRYGLKHPHKHFWHVLEVNLVHEFNEAEERGRHEISL